MDSFIFYHDYDMFLRRAGYMRYIFSSNIRPVFPDLLYTSFAHFSAKFNVFQNIY